MARTLPKAASGRSVTLIALLRGVNLAGHHKIKMDALRALCESLGLTDVCTYIQSGNILFRTKETEHGRLCGKIADAIEKSHAFRPPVVVRTVAQMRAIVEANPFAARQPLEPAKLAVNFLADEPAAEGREKVLGMQTAPDELRIGRAELYIYFPDGMGRSKLPMAAIEKALRTSGTSRNWNTVLKLLEMAEALESAA